MKQLLVLLVFSSAAAAAPRTCANGAPPRLTADLFAPIECSSATPPVAPLPVPPARPQSLDLKAWDGTYAYEGTAIQGFGRYALRLELRSGRSGRVEAKLQVTELQFHAVSTHDLKLVAARGSGRYATVLTTDALPGRELRGTATLGTVDVSTPPAGARQMDFLFANGALYRVRLTSDGPSTVGAQVWWAVPGAPPRSFETALTRLPPAQR